MDHTLFKLVCEKEYELLLRNHRWQKLVWSWTTYIRMNSHICHWSPSFRVVINNWRRKGFDKQPEAKTMDTYGSMITPASLRHRHSWILRDAIHVRSETEKKTPWPMTLDLLACKYGWVESDSLVRFAIRWDQSPRNWHRRLSHFGTNPRGWSI